MNIYISGISGTGMGALAQMAVDAGNVVFGSDKSRGAVTEELEIKNIEMRIGRQDGEFLAEKAMKNGVDWFVYTSALSSDHAELVLAKKLGIKTSKRDDLIEYLVRVSNLKMVAVAGTHGKTTTTAMMVWLLHKLSIPASYLVGSTLPWADSGKYDSDSRFFIYEADEYDRNFLKFHPWLSVIPAVSYDHPDIYRNREEYLEAFDLFRSQCELVVENVGIADGLDLPGELRRHNASLVLKAAEKMLMFENIKHSRDTLIKILNEFPGAGRRFERIANGVYSDYGHHPEEVAATVKMAIEMSDKVVVVYEPHQNTRQHEVFLEYKDVFIGVSKVFWLPTYLTREKEGLRILEPSDFIETLSNKEVAESADKDEMLAVKLKKLRDEGYIVLLMSAGPADDWLRSVFDTKRVV
jgi:UDP-N-acetylmuramate--alanine ligase